MSVESEAKRIAECEHPMPIRFYAAMRCPHCGAMRVGDGPWALPHLVVELVKALKEATPS